MRAMVLDWPADKQTALIDDQFMCGPSLLIAPMFKGETARSVYLPAGDWYDFWTGEKFAGGRRIGVAKPIEQIPVFVKGNSLLPLAKPLERVAPDACFELNVRAYGDKPQPFTLFEDDGLTNDYAAGKQNKIVLDWHAGKVTETKTGGYAVPQKYKIISSEIVGGAN
jgi:alpha-D-xyloside xylohydrolase